MNFAICDDCIQETVLIKHILCEQFRNCNIEVFQNGRGLLEYLKKNVPDIVLLDVEMPDLNGLQTAKMIRESYPMLGIIFITGHSQYALEAFSVYAFDFILKPLNRKRLINSINMIVDKTADDNSVIEIKSGGTIFRVNQQDIIFIEKVYNRCYIYTGKFEYNMRATLKYFSERLNPDIFIKTHSGYIVNKTKILSLVSKGNLSYEINFEATDKKAILSRSMRNILTLS